MSWIETALNTSKEVKSQYDYKIASNQCSWCAFEFIKNSKLLLNIENVNFIENYNKCIEEASRLRLECNKYKCGENIDDINILNHYKLNIINFYKTELNKNQKETFLEILDEELKNTFFKRENIIDLNIDILKNYIYEFLPHIGHFMIINRYGQSFSLLGLSDNKIMLFDSHFKKTGITNLEKAFEYITKDLGGYNMILWAIGYLNK
jgi:hypothetical protein